MRHSFHRGLALDHDTIEMLKLIAEKESDEYELPNMSLAIRRMIRARAAELGIHLPANNGKGAARNSVAPEQRQR